MPNGNVKLINAALDQFEGGNMILRGLIDPASIPDIIVPPYQREVMSASSLSEIVNALKNPNSGVPDVYLGMRGEDFFQRNEAVFLKSEVYVVDGLQRLSAARKVHELGGHPRLGAMVFLNTIESWEREMFRKLNTMRSRVSINVILRNMKEDNQAINALYSLCGDQAFVMVGRVSWSQLMKRNELITAGTLVKIVGLLHTHIRPGKTNQIGYLAPSLEKLVGIVGRNTLRANVKHFFEVIDECYGIRRVAYREAAVYMRSNFLFCLADIFSLYPEFFWNGNMLNVERDWRRKLALFPLDDPNVAKMAAASGSAREVLRLMIINHLNSGKRTKRLPMKSAVIVDAEEHHNGDAEDLT